MLRKIEINDSIVLLAIAVFFTILCWIPIDFSPSTPTVFFKIITKATNDGTLHTRDWDAEPLFPIPNADMADKKYVF